MWNLFLKPATSLSLALQGGGAHGAFTWGVLDTLLERGVPITALSGASAGAMNALVVAHALSGGSHADARAALARFWSAVGRRAPPGWFTDGLPPGLTPAARLLMHWTRVLSPYQFNPLDISPLRDILREQIDFERLRRARGPEVFISATHANSGRLRVFRRTEMSLEAALASACLPTIHQAVLVDGEPYWDGAYAANPALFPLVNETGADDLLIIMLSPLEHGQMPRTAPDIHARAVEIAFNATFLREVRTLAELKARVGRARWQLGRLERRLARLRFHLIDAEDSLAPLPGETRLVAHLPFLEHLRDLGRARAIEWWRVNGASLGRASSVDLLHLFGSVPPPARSTRAGAPVPAAAT